MSNGAWEMRGEYMESCNCDYLCPCLYTNPQAEVTYDNCTALLVFRIDEGSRGDVDLSGLRFALVIRSGKVMSEGGWVFGVIVDDDADDAQRAALAAIATGEAGGPPARIRDNLVSDFRGVEYLPITFEMDGETRATTIADKLSFAIKGVLSRLGNGKPYYVDNAGHPVSSRLALATSEETHLHCFGLDMDIENAGNNGHYAPFTWAA